ncbi:MULTISPECIES: circularly permuted type 2 ATP-grasp protein [Aneurinibacillus]|uniref:Uncharacterized conserved protein, circularly permuted ATPgrasp superfamily n=1 Tax=Aneurinibacillus thermoaerophilus TaxID=143495 RepID=A0A1G8F3F5_ANETH|nr:MULTISPECIES: circularly permuted type 2 ATP-grasp protein [Aneurinibacillus]AMA73431.1 hypothetical protein ACH33_11575 [Aneurinibacillus sp. XH2]MED0738642.1 hypothetical protein [Aneurinibacillus thermoaerophilus]MED0758917.1 hypothetical protein [Aneurinibacillus thermoaerophilus]MED0760631.1 hypothetical protein [Aneurinibacillus thermoaerophilus]QYY43996.1 hypothetical protein K3F53_07380 [Aneurinibacillus thermoaerophilus]
MIDLLFEEQYKQTIENNRHNLPQEIASVVDRCDSEGFVFRNKPFPLYPRISILPVEVRNEIQKEAEKMIDILEKVIELYANDQRTREFFMLGEQAQELVKIDPGYKRKIQISRFDTYLVPGKDVFKILENNTDCPAGVIFTGRILEVMKRISVLDAYLRKLPPLRKEGIDTTDAFIRQLLDTYQEFRPGSEMPSVAILQVRGKESKEVGEMVKQFALLGIEAIIADPRDLQYRRGKLYSGDLAVDLVWNKINTADFIPLLDEAERIKNYLNACKDQAICQVNSFQARFITESKLCMAYLSTPSFSHYFTEEERNVISKHIPWARKLEDGSVEYRGKQIELKQLALEEQERFVIKTAYDIRGEGVLIGCSTPSDRWKEILEECWNKPFILQEFIPAPEIEVPVDDCRSFSKKKFSTDLFMFGGKFQGFGSKISDEFKVNIFQNGSKQVILSLAEGDRNGKSTI